MARRIWSWEQKLAIVREMLQGMEPVTAVCQRHQVALSQAYRWRDAFLASGQQGLQDRRAPQHRDPLREENRRLKELVGTQALIIDAQKKLAGLCPEAGNGSWSGSS